MPRAQQQQQQQQQQAMQASMQGGLGGGLQGGLQGGMPGSLSASLQNVMQGGVQGGLGGGMQVNMQGGLAGAMQGGLSQQQQPGGQGEDGQVPNLAPVHLFPDATGGQVCFICCCCFVVVLFVFLSFFTAAQACSTSRIGISLFVFPVLFSAFPSFIFVSVQCLCTMSCAIFLAVYHLRLTLPCTLYRVSISSLMLARILAVPVPLMHN